MSFENAMILLGSLNAVGVFTLIGKAWAWQMEIEARLTRIETELGLLYGER